MTGEAVLFLGPEDSPLLTWLAGVETRVIQTREPIDAPFLETHGVGWLVSYGYRHILRPEVLDRLPGRAVNLHIAYLPWNRGADPNLWSFVDDTPKGVTLHHLDPGVDTGDIIVRRRVDIPATATLASSYRQLQDAIQTLFRETWPAIRAARAPRHPQRGTGSFHRVRDRRAVEPWLSRGWNTPVSALTDIGTLCPGSHHACKET